MLYLKGSYEVFLSLWSVTSCLCKDKIREVTKTKVSKPKIFLIKVKTLPVTLKHVYITMWTISIRRGFSNAVVLKQPCQGDAVNSNAFCGRAFREPRTMDVILTWL